MNPSIHWPDLDQQGRRAPGRSYKRPLGPLRLARSWGSSFLTPFNRDLLLSTLAYLNRDTPPSIPLGHEGLLAQGGPHVGLLGPARGEFDGRGRQIVIGDEGEQVADAVEPRAALRIRVHHEPGGLFDVGVGEHLILRLGILHPAGARFQVHRRELPAARGVFDARVKAALLLLVAHREPVFDQDDARAREHPLERGA